MNINGRDITAQDLIDKLDQLSGTWYNMMYKIILEDIAMWKAWPGTKYKKRKLLNEIIQHYIATEEYEKCAKLTKLKEW
jgi:hypothetical protein|tara:strand:- start:2956 stop:3192 length:237 start_codon:yes stop_codon:yes gene_type:complete